MNRSAIDDPNHDQDPDLDNIHSRWNRWNEEEIVYGRRKEMEEKTVEIGRERKMKKGRERKKNVGG